MAAVCTGTDKMMGILRDLEMDDYFQAFVGELK